MEKKPLILVFTSFYKPNFGGAEIAVSEIIKRLRDDFDFFILTHRVRRDLPSFENDGGVLIYRLGFGTRFDRMFLFPFWAATSAYLLLRQFRTRPVLMWGVMVSYASCGAFLLKLIKPKIPFLLTIQDGDEEWRPRLRNLGLATLWWWLIFTRTNYVTAISTYLLEKARHFGYKGPAMIIPNGVDEKLAHKELTPAVARLTSGLAPQSGASSEFIIFTASRLVYKNGIDILLRACDLLESSTPFRLVIAGDGPERENLEKLAKELNLDGKIKFLGNIAYEDLAKFYRSADLFVRPSRSEGLGSAFLEAMAAGVITIGTKVGGIPEFLIDGETGLLAKPENSEDLANVIRIGLTLTQEKKNQIIKNAQDLIKKKFLWKDIAQKMREVFSPFVLFA